MNPDRFIAESNIGLMREGREFDGGYNASLSDDAVPVLVAVLPELDEEQRCRVSGALIRRYGSFVVRRGLADDLLGFNLGDSEARRVLSENLEMLHTARCSDAPERRTPRG